MPAQVSLRHLFEAGKTFRVGLILFLLIALSRSSTSSGTFTQDAYIWQRDWTPALAAAIDTSSDIVNGWRILAGETDGSSRLFQVSVDWQVLRTSGRPVTLVLRINGQLKGQDESILLDRFASIVNLWNDNLGGLRGVEIDHDCGTAHLVGYARFLTRLRRRIAPALRLSITALPTWLASPALDEVLDATDQSVLQVHAVRDAHAGLIDTESALRWVGEFARRDHKPFQVALPAYGLRVDWRKDGTISAVEGEMPGLAGTGDSTELVAQPSDMAQLARALRQGAFGNLTGIAWFRLPTADDNRAWSLQTWRAVVGGRRPTTDVAIMARESGQAGSRAISLINKGEADAILPGSIRLPGGCTMADGINGYAPDYRATGLFLRRINAGLLKTGQVREVGWMRCADDAEGLHVEP